MGIGQELAEISSLLIAIFEIIQGGVYVSGIMYLSHSITLWLSRYTGVEKPDPVKWKRTWERFFNRNFHNIGLRTAKNWHDQKVRCIIYQLTISVVAMIVVFSIYFFLSGVTVGATFISYYSVGYAPNMSPLIEQFAALSVLLGFAIIWHSTNKNIQPAN